MRPEAGETDPGAHQPSDGLLLIGNYAQRTHAPIGFCNGGGDGLFVNIQTDGSGSVRHERLLSYVALQGSLAP